MRVFIRPGRSELVLRIYLAVGVLLMMLGACDDSTSSLPDAGGAAPDATVTVEPDILSDFGVPADPALLPGAALFDPESLIEVSVELSREDWELVRWEGRDLTRALTGCDRDFEYTYVRGRVSIGGDTYEDVAVRKKGFLGSLSSTRPSLKLNFGKYVDDRTHEGMRRMTLNNNEQDPSNTHQCMAYALFAKAGVMASRCNLARVTVNGEDLGIYTHVESVKKPMIARYFDDDGGNLYEGQGADFVPEHREFIELKTNEEENDRSDFDRLSAALTVPDEDLLSALSDVIDLEAFFRFWVMEVITGHWDSYSGGRNNYLTYKDPTSGLFYFIPWGTDGSFSMLRPFTPGNTAATVLAQGLIASRLYNHPEGRIMYFDRLRILFEHVWTESDLLAEAERIGELTGAPLWSIEAQKAFIVNHGAAILRELDADPVEWVGGGATSPIMCFADLATEASGTFSTTWLSDSSPTPGQSAELILNGQPWMPGLLLGTAGFDQRDPGLAQVRYISPQPDGMLIAIGLSIPLELFDVGVHRMHGLETAGIVFRFNGADLSSATLIGFIGDGTITLDEASLEEGGAISGSFEGRLLQFQPL